MFLAASSRSVVAGSLQAAFPFLHILISLVYYSRTSGEVIYGQPRWYDKLIYNCEASARCMSSLTVFSSLLSLPPPRNQVPEKFTCLSVQGRDERRCRGAKPTQDLQLLFNRRIVASF